MKRLVFEFVVITSFLAGTALADTKPAGTAVAPPNSPATSETTTADTHLAAGLAAYRHLNLKEAATQLEAAHEQDPQSAAAAWYLGYTVYMLADRRQPFDPGKQRAAELFAQAYAIDPHFQPTLW
jgi:hypothetical protein